MTAPANSHTATSGGLRSARGWIMLCADDYAMTEGVTRSILELASAARLSATSAMTTSRHWPDAAEKLARARDRVSTGLHVNLTLGPPLGPLPRLAPGGKLPTIGDITAQAIGGKLDTTELRAEIAAISLA